MAVSSSPSSTAALSLLQMRSSMHLYATLSSVPTPCDCPLAPVINFFSTYAVWRQVEGGGRLVELCEVCGLPQSWRCLSLTFAQT